MGVNHEERCAYFAIIVINLNFHVTITILTSLSLTYRVKSYDLPYLREDGGGLNGMEGAKDFLSAVVLYGGS